MGNAHQAEQLSCTTADDPPLEVNTEGDCSISLFALRCGAAEANCCNDGRVDGFAVDDIKDLVPPVQSSSAPPEEVAEVCMARSPLWRLQQEHALRSPSATIEVDVSSVDGLEHVVVALRQQHTAINTRLVERDCPEDLHPPAWTPPAAAPSMGGITIPSEGEVARRVPSVAVVLPARSPSAAATCASARVRQPHGGRSCVRGGPRAPVRPEDPRRRSRTSPAMAIIMPNTSAELNDLAPQAGSSAEQRQMEEEFEGFCEVPVDGHCRLVDI